MNRLVLLAGVATVMGCQLAPSAAEAAPGERTMLFRSSQGVCYHIPALIRTESGALVAMAEQRFSYNKASAARFKLGTVDPMPTGQRPKGCADSGMSNVAMRRSTDGGKNWSENKVVVDFHRFLDGGYQIAAVQNPTLVAKGDRTILLFNVFRSKAARNEASCIVAERNAAKCPSPTEQSIWQIVSNDGGAKWSAPAQVNIDLDPKQIHRIGPGHGTVLASGRIVVPTFNFLMMSDDDGRSWKAGATTKGTRQGGKTLDGGEASVAQLPDGTLWMSSRPSSRSYREVGGKPFRVSAFSGDNGATYRTVEADTRFPTPAVHNSLLSWQGVMLSAYPYSTRAQEGDAIVSTDRERLTIGYSRDGGKSWGNCLIDGSTSSYSDMAGLDRGNIALIYETTAKQGEKRDRGWIDGITFKRVPLDSLGKSCPTPG